MIGGIGAFSTMDALIKWLTSDYSVAQIVALRSWFGLPVLFLIVHFEGGTRALWTRRPIAHFRDLEPANRSGRTASVCPRPGLSTPGLLVERELACGQV